MKKILEITDQNAIYQENGEKLQNQFNYDEFIVKNRKYLICFHIIMKI